MSLIKSGTILFAASMLGNVSNYLFQFFMSRRLTVEDYGAMNSMFSILGITGIPATTVMFVVAKYVSEFSVKGDKGSISVLYRNSLIKMAALGGVCFFPFLVFGASISGYLKINGVLPVVIVGAGVFSAFIVTVNLGALQGLKSFFYLGAGTGLLGAVKLVLGIVLIFAGFGFNGAVSAAAFSGFFVFAITAIPLSGYLKGNRGSTVNGGEILSYSIPVLLSSLAFAVLTNIDLILVKHIFSPEEAGMYSAVSVLGKTILYLPSAIVLALFPMVSEADAVNSDAFRILNRGLLYTAAISSFGVAGFILFPEFFLKVLFGSRFSNAAPLLKYYSLAMMAVSVTSILITFNLARRKTGFIYTLWAGSLALVVLINLFHGSLLSVVVAMTGVGVALAAFNLWLVYQDRKSGEAEVGTEGVCER